MSTFQDEIKRFYLHLKWSTIEWENPLTSSSSNTKLSTTKSTLPPLSLRNMSKNQIMDLCPVSKRIKEFDFSFDKKMSAVDDPSARGQNKIHRHAYIYFPKTNFNQNILVNFHLVTCKLSSIVHTIFSLCHLIVSWREIVGVGMDGGGLTIVTFLLLNVTQLS